MKKWENPQVQNLSLVSTKDGAGPYYYWPDAPACNDASTHSGEQCPKKLRPCMYYIFGKCTAPGAPDPTPSES